MRPCPILWGHPRQRLVGPRRGCSVGLAQDPGRMEEEAARAGIGCAIGRQAVGLRQEGVSNQGTQQSPKAHKEMENLGGKRGRMGGGMSSFIPHSLPCLPSGEPLPGQRGEQGSERQERRGVSSSQPPACSGITWRQRPIPSLILPPFLNLNPQRGLFPC